MPETFGSELPFDIQKSESLSKRGEEADIRRMTVSGEEKQGQEIALKETRSIEIANDAEMQKLKTAYEYLKNDPEFGKFVLDTSFVKARDNPEDEPHAYLVQKFIPGKRIDEISNEELYGNKELMQELLEFVDASIAILEKTEATPELTPDFFADQEFIKGNVLHNPRYSGNIIIADPEANLARHVYFVDTGALYGPGHKVGVLKKLRRTIDNQMQIVQFKRWKAKLQVHIK